MPLASRFAFLSIAILVMAIGLPELYSKIFSVKIAPTQMFYSPVHQSFVFREHHGDHDFVYSDQTGRIFDRKGFETAIPFIYYKNMDLWGLLPLTLNGQRFDLATMRENRQVFELSPREIKDRRPAIAIQPLLESNPGRTRLQFPEDVFRMTKTDMVFVNVDHNVRDEALTTTFTAALKQAGFTFPAGLIAGKDTILKPFDEGYFIADATGAIFHVKRVNGALSAVRTPIPTDLQPRHIKVSENKARAYYGFLLTQEGRLYLISYDQYRLIPLPSDGYDPDRMSYKILLNPLYKTAIYGDDHVIRAVAMDPDFQPFDRYERPVPGPDSTLSWRVMTHLFPFRLTLADRTSAFLDWHVHWHGVSGLMGSALCLLAWFGVQWQCRRRASGGISWRSISWRPLKEALLILCTGLFGLIAVLMIPEE